MRSEVLSLGMRVVVSAILANEIDSLKPILLFKSLEALFPKDPLFRLFEDNYDFICQGKKKEEKKKHQFGR